MLSSSSLLHELAGFLHSSYAAQQLAPLFVLFFFPAFTLLVLRVPWSALARRSIRILSSFVLVILLAQMVLEALGVGFLWGWGKARVGTHGEGREENGQVRAKKRKIRVGSERTDEEGEEVSGMSVLSMTAGVENFPVPALVRGCLGAHVNSSDADTVLVDENVYYPGLVNISGTYCFLNSVLQAMASLAYLQPYLETIQARAIELDVPTPVLDNLQDTLNVLNTPKSSRSSLRPVPIINALSQPLPGSTGRSKLFSSREHQDAQELFQLLSECLKGEALSVEREGVRDYGLGAYTRSDSDGGTGSLPESVFDGLTANRRSCVECGYTEAVMHFTIDNWTLSLPRGIVMCQLAECLEEYVRLEVLTDCICRRCSMLATLARVKADLKRLTGEDEMEGDGGGEKLKEALSPSKKKRVREAKKLVTRVRAAIDEGRIEEDIQGLKMEKVFSRVSTKQAMIARPPKVLVLHLNRSIHTGSYAGRNPCRIIFPEVLDLTPYTTTGSLSTAPSTPISAPALPIPRSRTPTQASYASSSSSPRVLYRLAAVVCHYGTHSFGHYVCYRRKPVPVRSGVKRTSTTATKKGKGKGAAEPVRLVPPQMGSGSGNSAGGGSSGGESELAPDEGPGPGTGRGWLRCSDDAVSECGIEEVLSQAGGAFLLFYERAMVQLPLVPPLPFPTESSASAIPIPIPTVPDLATSSSSTMAMSSSVGSSSSSMSGSSMMSSMDWRPRPRATSTSIGVGMGTGMGMMGVGRSVYMARDRDRTPRSSEETVRPATISGRHGDEGEDRLASNTSPSSGLSLSSSSSLRGGGGVGMNGSASLSGSLGLARSWDSASGGGSASSSLSGSGTWIGNGNGSASASVSGSGSFFVTETGTLIRPRVVRRAMNATRLNRKESISDSGEIKKSGVELGGPSISLGNGDFREEEGNAKPTTSTMMNGHAVHAEDENGDVNTSKSIIVTDLDSADDDDNDDDELGSSVVHVNMKDVDVDVSLSRPINTVKDSEDVTYTSTRESDDIHNMTEDVVVVEEINEGRTSGEDKSRSHSPSISPSTITTACSPVPDTSVDMSKLNGSAHPDGINSISDPNIINNNNNSSKPSPKSSPRRKNAKGNTKPNSNPSSIPAAAVPSPSPSPSLSSSTSPSSSTSGATQQQQRSQTVHATHSHPPPAHRATLELGLRA